MNAQDIFLACRVLVLSRRAQEAGQSMRAIINDAPAGTFTSEELQDFARRDQEDRNAVGAALSRLVSLTGSNTMGAEILANANLLIRAEHARTKAADKLEAEVVGARLTLRWSPLRAIVEDITEARHHLKFAVDVAERVRLAERIEELASLKTEMEIQGIPNLAELS